MIGGKQVHRAVNGGSLAGVIRAAADKIIVRNEDKLVADEEQGGVGRIAAANGDVPIGSESRRHGVAAVPINEISAGKSHRLTKTIPL